MEITQTPYQCKQPQGISYSGEEHINLSQEIKELLTKGAIVEAQMSISSYISQIFLLKKKGGVQRLVINLKDLNNFVKSEHFKMEGIHVLPDLIQQGDWMIKLDLKDAYLQLPIHKE